MRRSLVRFVLAGLTAFCCFPVVAAAQIVVTLGNNPIHIDDGLTLDPEGNLYGSSFVSGTTGRLRTVTPAGVDEVFTDEIVDPLGHDFDSEGNLYVASFYANRIYRLFPDGSSELLTDQIFRPAGVAMGPDGHLYVAAYGSSGAPGDKIYRVSLTGLVEVFATSSFFDGPVGIEFDEVGNLYVGSYNRGYITRVSPAGIVEHLATVPGPNGFNTGYVCYANNAIYATGIGTHKVYRLPLDTLVLETFAGTGIAGHVDGEAGEARFGQPNGLVASATGDTIYVSEYGNKTVRMIISGDTSDAPVTDLSHRGGLRLRQSTPNPSNGAARIVFSLEEPTSVLLQVFDVQGRGIKTLLDAVRPAGTHDVDLDTSGLANGVYSYRLTTSRGMISRQLTVLH